MEMTEVLLRTEGALQRGQSSTVIELANQLICAGPEWAMSGYYFRGVAFETGGDGIVPDFWRATQDYLHVAMIAPDASALRHLARALMKQGHANYAAAFKYLQQCSEMRGSPALDLGFAEYFKTKTNPDFALARDYYWRAAVRGRIFGFLGYAEMSRLLGQPVRAKVVDGIRRCVQPLLESLLGSAARERF